MHREALAGDLIEKDTPVRTSLMVSVSISYARFFVFGPREALEAVQPRHGWGPTLISFTARSTYLPRKLPKFSAKFLQGSRRCVDASSFVQFRTCLLSCSLSEVRRRQQIVVDAGAGSSLDTYTHMCAAQRESQDGERSEGHRSMTDGS